MYKYAVHFTALCSGRDYFFLQASRETVSRLADYATESNKDATDQLYTLKAQLEAERENSLSSELKLREFQVVRSWDKLYNTHKV